MDGRPWRLHDEHDAGTAPIHTAWPVDPLPAPFFAIAATKAALGLSVSVPPCPVEVRALSNILVHPCVCLGTAALGVRSKRTLKEERTLVSFSKRSAPRCSARLVTYILLHCEEEEYLLLITILAFIGNQSICVSVCAQECAREDLV